MLRKRVSELQLLNLDKILGSRRIRSKVTVIENGKQMIFELVMPEDADPDKDLFRSPRPSAARSSARKRAIRSRCRPRIGRGEFEIVKLVTIHDEE